MTEIKLEDITPEDMAVFKKVRRILSLKGGVATKKRWLSLSEEEKDTFRQNARQRMLDYYKNKKK